MGLIAADEMPQFFIVRPITRIGTVANGHFVVTDLSGKVLISVPTKSDAELKRPVPLKMAVVGDAIRLYLGKKYVEIKFAASK